MAINFFASTWGICLASVWLETILFGMGILQTWLYFHWYPKDAWGLKLTVVILVIIEILQVTFLFASIYNALILNFGNLETVFNISWIDPAQILFGFLSAFLVQLYFAYCIFRLKGKPIVIIAIVALALTQIVAGIVEVANMAILPSFLDLTSHVKVVVILQSTATVLCDIVITVALCVILQSKKSAIKATNTALGKLITFGINRGAFTCLGAALNLILFLAVPDTFFFFLGLTVSSKLYMNALLSTLNTRHYVANSSYASRADPNHLWQSVALGQNSTGRSGEEVSGQRTKVVAFDQSPAPFSAKENFTSNMI